MYKVQIFENQHVNKILYSENPFEAIEEFKKHVSKRLDDSHLVLVNNTTMLWDYDLRPETRNDMRWRAKNDIFSNQSILPIWIPVKEAAAIFNVTVQRIHQIKKEKLIQNYDLVDNYGVTLFDRRVLEQYLGERYVY